MPKVFESFLKSLTVDQAIEMMEYFDADYVEGFSLDEIVNLLHAAHPKASMKVSGL